MIDGMVINSVKPFEVFSSFPRNDSTKSAASTIVQ